jgi:hypothetical protein
LRPGTACTTSATSATSTSAEAACLALEDGDVEIILLPGAQPGTKFMYGFQDAYDPCLWKTGSAEDVKARLRRMHTDYKVTMRPRLVYPGCEALEDNVHWVLEEFKTNEIPKAREFKRFPPGMDGKTKIKEAVEKSAMLTPGFLPNNDEEFERTTKRRRTEFETNVLEAETKAATAKAEAETKAATAKAGAETAKATAETVEAEAQIELIRARTKLELAKIQKDLAELEA